MRRLTRQAIFLSRGSGSSSLDAFDVRGVRGGADGVWKGWSPAQPWWSVQKALEDARAIFACPYFELRLEERGVPRLIAGDEPDVGEQQVQLARVQGAGVVQVCAGRGLRVVVGAGWWERGYSVIGAVR
jgi:hypothetical protein